MRRAYRWRLATTVLALCLAATFPVAHAPEAGAKEVDEDRTPLSVVDLFGVDLIGQTAATTSSPAVIRLRIADEPSTGTLRVRLYRPVTTRAELLEATSGSPPTPLLAEWTVENARVISTDDQGVVLSVPIQPPREALTSPIFDDPRPLPLQLEVIDATGAAVRGLTTFLTPGADDPAGHALTVAVVLDLRLPPSHLADGSAAVDEASLGRVLGLAEVLIERSGVPLSVAVSPETLDGLALIGDDASVAVLRAALQSRQLLTTTWTSLDLYDWTRAVRIDVILDGLRKSAEALRWAGLEASPVMHVEHPPALRVARAVTEPATGVNAFVANAIGVEGGPLPPVTSIADASDRSYLLVQSDPSLSAMLQRADAELGAQWALAELSRMAAEGTPGAVVVSAVAAEVEPAALALLLDGIDAGPSLDPATVDDVLARHAPVGTASIAGTDRTSDPGDFGLYMARRIQVEQRLEAYESFLPDDPFLTAPLRTLLAVSASEHLTTGERTGFLNAVDRQVTQGAAGVEFVGRGPITVTTRSADLPVTLVNNRAAPVTVALELASAEIAFTGDERGVFTLEAGRNELLVPVEVAASGRTSVRVTVTTPDQASAITLATGTFTVRFADAEGIGFLILVLAAVALAAWWLQTLRRRARDTENSGATVAAPSSVSDSVEAGSETGIPSSGDHTRT